uniref:Uncharacterized protein n=1 Tax=Arundo donax TaxID=35708 RepID=A0A0A9HBK3_ARUDO
MPSRYFIQHASKLTNLILRLICYRTPNFLSFFCQNL